MRFGIELVGFSEWGDYLRTAPEEWRELIRAKVEYLTDMLRQRVLQNLSGELLSIRSGKLFDSIQQRVEVSDRTITGWVGPVPADAKALTQELGGQGYYQIVATTKNMLRFFWEKQGIMFVGRSVWHPPLDAREYLASALYELEPEINAEFEELIDEMTR